jgi:hypothetical protein
MNPCGLRSLLDVLQLYAPAYVSIGRMYEDYLRGPNASRSDPKAVPNDEQYAELLAVLRSLQRQCADTQMPISARSMERTILQFEKSRPNFQTSQQQIESWFNCFNSELETQLHLLVLPHRATYHPGARETHLGGVGDVPSGGIGPSLVFAVSRFKDAQYDAYHAGCCFAYGCFTACVYHLMRTAEHGLVSVAAAINVPQEKLSKGWDGCIQGIESAIKTISSTKPTADWQDQVKKYSDLCAWFTTIKTGWRNPVSHVPRIYSEGSAMGMFSATMTLFEHLTAYGFQQTAMPSDPLSLPSEQP